MDCDDDCDAVRLDVCDWLGVMLSDKPPVCDWLGEEDCELVVDCDLD